MALIRPVAGEDLSLAAEIIIENYRLNFYPLFRNDRFYFQTLQVIPFAAQLRGDESFMAASFVYEDDGIVKGVISLAGREIRRLFVDPFFQNRGIGAELLAYAVERHGADFLWALEKNSRALRFYARHDFYPSGERRLEEGTEEYLIRLARRTREERSTDT